MLRFFVSGRPQGLWNHSIFSLSSLNGQSQIGEGRREFHKTNCLMVRGGVPAIHVKPSRFPRHTNGKRGWNPLYKPKESSPWYHYVKEALDNPIWNFAQQEAKKQTDDPTLSGKLQEMKEKEEKLHAQMEKDYREQLERDRKGRKEPFFLVGKKEKGKEWTKKKLFEKKMKQKEERLNRK
mmetsp:Transcript_985/g.1427  ORF Transcript_985/g.1427 Transcript_985/m.1427 type:complete len:180 (+) Transcript_985:502-1041(+)